MAPMKNKRWRTILCDYPWPNQSGEAFYNTESLKRLREFPLSDLIDDSGCHVWFWTTNRYLKESYEILEAAGLTVRSPLTWVKFRLGLGGRYGLRNATEHLLFATKGKLELGNHSTPTWLNAPVGAHSEKPGASYELIEKISPGPRLELFARNHRPGWDDVWGDEVESTISIPGWPVPSDFTREEVRS